MQNTKRKVYNIGLILCTFQHGLILPKCSTNLSQTGRISYLGSQALSPEETTDAWQEQVSNHPSNTPSSLTVIFLNFSSNRFSSHLDKKSASELLSQPIYVTNPCLLNSLSWANPPTFTFFFFFSRKYESVLSNNQVLLTMLN